MVVAFSSSVRATLKAFDPTIRGRLTAPLAGELHTVYNFRTRHQRATLLTMKTLEAIRFTRVEGLRLLDQRLLPFTEEWVDVKNAQEAHDAIKSMLVRGAPAIGVTAALGMATDALAKHHAGGYATPLSVVDDVEAMGSMLNTSRPTAVNLMDATALLRRVARAAIVDEASASVDSVVEAVVSAAEGYAREDVESNRKMGGFGADAVQSAVAKSLGRQRSSDGKVRVLTH